MGRPGLDKHPKFRRLQHILNCPRPHARGYLECLWETAYENGDPAIGDATDVELACGWEGEPGDLARALESCGGARAGFLEQLEGVYYVHDLYDHAPDYVQKRMRRESARIAKGVTISELRAKAGRLGGEAKARQMQASAGKCPPLATSGVANGATPAPAPAPAPKEEEPSGDGSPARDVDPRLLDILNRWNGLSAGVANARARVDPPAKAVLAGWARVQADPEAREPFGDPATLFDRIQKASFCHGQGWFRIPWLFGKGKTGEWNAVKLSEGGYEGNGDGSPAPPPERVCFTCKRPLGEIGEGDVCGQCWPCYHKSEANG